MNPLPTQRAGELQLEGAQTQWLIQELWTDQAVGILGGEPKCCKSFLALDMALSVASGAPCLRRFAVARSGPVLLFPAEDSLPIVRRRLEGIARAAGRSLQSLPIEVITASALRLDIEKDRQRLTLTVERVRPRLLILDPLIRLHQLDENDAGQIAGLLSFLRELQRRFALAVVLVHHSRKNAGSARPGQALRGSSELHGWGDSNLYMRRRAEHLSLCAEHRAAPSLESLALQLAQEGDALSLRLVDGPGPAPVAAQAKTSVQRVLHSLKSLQHPVSLQNLRQLCAMRTASLCSALEELQAQGLVRRQSEGYQLIQNPVSLSLPIEMTGNGNGKRDP